MKGRGLFGLFSLPFTGTSEDMIATSRAAANAQLHSQVERDRAAILDYITTEGDSGATDDEIENATSIKGNSARPRRVELARAGLIEGREGITRKTRSGRPAVVWFAKGKS